MLSRFKKSFAKVALVALLVQMTVMVAPTGTHAATTDKTSLTTTYASPVISVGLNTAFTNSVKIQGKVFDDAVATQAYNEVILTRTDDTLAQVKADDVVVTLDALTGSEETVDSHLVAVRNENANTLVLRFEIFTLLDTYNDGVTHDFDVKIKKAGTYKFQNQLIYENVDPLGILNATSADQGNVITIDATSPTAIFVAKTPTNLKTIPVSIVFSEPVVGFDLTKLTVTNGTAQNLAGSTVQYQFEIVPSNLLVEGDITVDLAAAMVTDLVGNPNVAKQLVIHYDPTAPGAVTGLVANGNADGTVTLTWTNPADGYVGLQIKRDGVFLTTLPVGTTTFTDTSVVRGQTYGYTVTAYDAAGNVTMATPVQVTVPVVQVAAAVSDSSSFVAADTEVSDQGTVTSTENKADTKGDENKKTEEGLPSWAIMLLVVLAAIGGYLIYNQKPVTTPVVPVAKKSSNNVPKKTTPNKKK